MINQTIPYTYYEPNRADVRKNITLILYHGWGSSIKNIAFLAKLLSKWGYHVFTPEINHHDSRDPLENPFKKEIQERYFWKTIIESAVEAVEFAGVIQNHEPFTKHRTVLIGSSMGGFISSRAFLIDDRFDGLVNINGSCAWMQCETFFQKAGFKQTRWIEEVGMQDPITHLDKLKERPVLLLHGENDQAIPARMQVHFYEKARTFYEDPNTITLELFPNVNHTTTLAMVERVVHWLESTFNPDFTKEY